MFKAELQAVFAPFVLRSVNTDGGAATQKAWHSLWRKIAIVECFLHAWLKVRNRAVAKMGDCSTRPPTGPGSATGRKTSS